MIARITAENSDDEISLFAMLYYYTLVHFRPIKPPPSEASKRRLARAGSVCKLDRRSMPLKIQTPFRAMIRNSTFGSGRVASRAFIKGNLEPSCVAYVSKSG